MCEVGCRPSARRCGARKDGMRPRTPGPSDRQAVGAAAPAAPARPQSGSAACDRAPDRRPGRRRAGPRSRPAGAARRGPSVGPSACAPACFLRKRRRRAGAAAARAGTGTARAALAARPSRRRIETTARDIPRPAMPPASAGAAPGQGLQAGRMGPARQGRAPEQGGAGWRPGGGRRGIPGAYSGGGPGSISAHGHGHKAAGTRQGRLFDTGPRAGIRRSCTPVVPAMRRRARIRRPRRGAACGIPKAIAHIVRRSGAGSIRPPSRRRSRRGGIRREDV